MSSSNNTSGNGIDKDSALVEYQAAQESAQHHDNLLWTTTNLIWTGSLILFGLILTQIENTSRRPLIIVLSILGICLSIFVWVISVQYRAIKNHKYERCKEIEKSYGLKQHSTLKYHRGSQRIFYAVIMIVFIIAWVFVLRSVSVWPFCIDFFALLGSTG